MKKFNLGMSGNSGGNGLSQRFWLWCRSEEGILIWILLFFPLGCYLLWKYGKSSKRIKVFASILMVLGLILFVSTSSELSKVTAEKDKLHLNYESVSKKAASLEKETQNLEKKQQELETTKAEFSAYKEKMEPYETLSEADTKKRENDANAADKVNKSLQALPSIDKIVVTDQEKVNSAQKLYEALTEEQKKLVDATVITQLNEKIKSLAAEEKAAAEKKAAEEAAAAEKKKQEEAAAAEKKKQEEAAAAQKAAEEAKGYETGTTYDQLARTPDSFVLTKIKFYGKVLQVMEGDDMTQIRLAVNDDYDKVIYCEYDSSIVTSRVLEDDEITVSGISMGLFSYESTMGGTITIPSMTVDKIE